MKTPREILFQHHRQAETKLDAVRRNALAALPRPECEAANQGEIPWHNGRQFGAPGLLKRMWQELIWPSRRAWTGLAGVWLTLLAVNLHITTGRPVTTVRAAPARVVAGAVQAQHRLLVELLQPVNAAPTDPARMAPAPRSERPTVRRAC